MQQFQTITVSTEEEQLQPYEYQVGGHHTQTDGPPVSLKDGKGRFLKKLQPGERSEREVAFYTTIEQYRQTAYETAHREAGNQAVGGTADNSEYVRHMQELAQWVPRSYGVQHVCGADYLVLQDIAADYHQPCVMDIKMGYRTWYPWATDKLQQKYRLKDESTTQSSLGFRVCGVRVHNCKTGDNWMVDRHWGKTLTRDNVHEAFHRFADNGYLDLQELLSGPGMLVDQLQQLASLFSRQQCWHFYSTSLLVLYEGTAQTAPDARVTVKLIDFAHGFSVPAHAEDEERRGLPGPEGVDQNFKQGLDSLLQLLTQQSADT